MLQKVCQLVSQSVTQYGKYFVACEVAAREVVAREVVACEVL